MFRNLAHRGASQHAPENTLAAFYKGIEMGANGLETDLRYSKDGTIFLLHDEMLDRTTNGTGSSSNYTWKELQELDAGSWFSAEYAGERLVSFESFIYIFGRKPLQLVLELKGDHLEEDVVRYVKKYDMLSNTIVTSFSYDSLKEVRRLDSEVKLGYLARDWDMDLLGRLREIQVFQLCPSAETLTEEHVRTLKQEGFEVRSWKVKDEQLMHHCLNCGVDGMTINFPEKLSEALQSR
ncbi:glycerophosphodiester phosphodiesterase [Paenibacillus thalictri]|uniref:GP-PDE domain-containing protein n=1 Tax=Paenibacillus thalictri TaxID=2527873 RepID=A0A4Q9DJ70_9BACL|nr:glycerophosphodiester phosphodiesterase family protein [Paenibacillus thalictri]TBL71390.1 hypothetical protein EYB31_30335 [Paenibacillus thalictri]